MIDRSGPLPEAAARAPDRAGVYFFLDADAELLYVGKAGSLRRRLQQHAHAQPGTGRRMEVLYRRAARHPVGAAAGRTCGRGARGGPHRSATTRVQR